ncbi:MAG: FHA domain-containing protein [Thermodesulfobacteriota bacterium]
MVVFAVVLLSAANGRGQPIEQLTINYIEAAAAADQIANEVRAYFTVSTAAQQPIRNLASSEFKALEDGKAVTLMKVAPTSDPMAVVLAIDTSGSMQARDKSGQTSMEAARKAAADFIAMLSADDRLALFSFNREPLLHSDFSSDHDAVISAVKTLEAKTNAYTCLYDTAFEAVKKAAEIPKGRRAVILLTDGKDERGDGPCSTHNVSDVIDLATTKTIRVPIYTIGVGPKVDAKELGRIANLTGGRSLLAASPDQLKGFYQTLADQLKNQYLLTYRSQAPSGEHSLVVKVQRQDRQGQDEKRFWVPPLPIMQPPTVSFVAVTPGEQSADILRVKVTIAPEQTTAKLRYYVDGALKSEITSPPFDVFDWNTAGLSAGTHILRVEVIDIKGQSGMAEITREVGAGLIPPGAAPDSTAPKDRSAGGFIILLAAALALVLAAAGGGIWWFRRRQKDAAAVQMVARTGTSDQCQKPARDIEDETVFWGNAAAEEKGAATAQMKVPAATLTVVQNQNLETGKTFELAGTTSIGRGDDNVIAIPDKAISRRHAEIYFDANRFYIRDLGSKYGTKVDGRDIVSGRAALVDGVEIQLGPRTTLKFHAAPQLETDDNTKTKSYDLDRDGKTLTVDPN